MGHRREGRPRASTDLGGVGGPGVDPPEQLAAGDDLHGLLHRGLRVRRAALSSLGSVVLEHSAAVWAEAWTPSGQAASPERDALRRGTGQRARPVACLSRSVRSGLAPASAEVTLPGSRAGRPTDGAQVRGRWPKGRGPGADGRRRATPPSTARPSPAKGAPTEHSEMRGLPACGPRPQRVCIRDRWATLPEATPRTQQLHLLPKRGRGQGEEEPGHPRSVRPRHGRVTNAVGAPLQAAVTVGTRARQGRAPRPSTPGLPGAPLELHCFSAREHQAVPETPR